MFFVGALHVSARETENFDKNEIGAAQRAAPTDPRPNF
jgi:hypothetical protein